MHSELKKISQFLVEVGRRDANKVEAQVIAGRRGNTFDVNHVTRKKNDYVLWHDRLGHAPMNKLKMIDCISNTCVETDDVCLTCPLTRFTRLPPSLSDSIACLRFELVHINIWGPYKVCTREKYRYIITIVDDFSRATSVYLLTLKSECLNVMNLFSSFVMNHFGLSIKTIRSDNALEFIERECKKFFGEQGMVHQTSCVDTPFQNERVERKHRNVLEMARALRMRVGLPLCYSGDYVLIAVYIINKLPNSILGHITPF